MANRLTLSSWKMGRIPHLHQFLSELPDGSAAGWGYTSASLRLQKRFGANFTFVEDGFLRSVGLGKEGAPPLSLILDNLGVYYDSSKPCTLDRLIKQAHVTDIRTLYAKLRLTKYNLERDIPVNLPATTREIVLIIDQVLHDNSIKYAGANEQTFFDMVEAAREMHPNAQIYLKSHPDVAAGLAKGVLAGRCSLPVLEGHFSPHALLDIADHVHTVSSQFGFEAMMRGVPVTTYAKPFYTKTDDIERLATAALLLYPTYIDPVFGEKLSAYEGLERLARWRDQSQGLLKSYSGYGFSTWKQGDVRKFLKAHGAEITYKPGASPLVWGKKVDMNAATMEDGFIRGRGLGSNLTPPLSLVIDDEGIYFDAMKPSRFERLVHETVFTPELLVRAEALRQTIIKKGITKYNLKIDTIKFENHRLVIGQVGDDASIKYGTFDINSNDLLLSTVRKNYPLDLIIYKQHPDVSSGNREGVLKDPSLADFIVTEGDVTPLFSGAKSVHTLSSLAGFEALLREIPVYCEGLPFYAGYGLTIDRHKTIRRTRKLTLQELIAITLIKYPLYTDFNSGIPIEVEEAMKIITLDRHKPRNKLYSYFKLSFINRFFR